MRITFALGTITVLLLISCGHARESVSETESEGFTPVTVTHPVIGNLNETIILNATSKFLLKTSVKSDMNGYIQKVLVNLGQRVSSGQELFVIRSKESEHLGNTVAKLDTSFHFSGTVSVRSPSDGYITELSYKTGDYVQDNEIIAAVSDKNSMVFLLELPYELINSLSENRRPELLLPDGKILKGTMESSLPAVDPVSQTLSCIIHIDGNASVPENLIATMKFIRKSKSGATILPREALLTDEVQTGFWIMKLIDSSLAVKTPVTIGLTTSDKVEIIAPALLPSDVILLTGNYGLPDSARVIVENQK
jgi:biotin carboxyl carrier protein